MERLSFAEKIIYLNGILRKFDLFIHGFTCFWYLKRHTLTSHIHFHPFAWTENVHSLPLKWHTQQTFSCQWALLKWHDVTLTSALGGTRPTHRNLRKLVILVNLKLQNKDSVHSFPFPITIWIFVYITVLRIAYQECTTSPQVSFGNDTRHRGCLVPGGAVLLAPSQILHQKMLVNCFNLHVCPRFKTDSQLCVKLCLRGGYDLKLSLGCLGYYLTP